jgi:hypothetical protein
MQDIPSLIDPAITELDECIFCHHAEMDDLNQCATCLEHICASCPMNACSCPGGYGIEAQLRTELRVKAMELGTFKAAGRQGIMSETQQERMNSLDSKVNNLIYELMICDKQYIPPITAKVLSRAEPPCPLP